MNAAHLSALEAKHAVIDQQIHAETHRPMPDSGLVATLKKQKLRLKDEMTER